MAKVSDDVIRARAKVIMSETPGMCFQHAIRRAIAEVEPAPEGAPTSMDGAYVTEITSAQAAAIIKRYEWLGTSGRAQFSAGLWVPVNNEPTLIGVSVFGWPGADESRDLCGHDNRHLAVALERGVCVHWAPKNAASFFIPKAVALAAEKKGWRVFYAYSDPAAGEVGTVYQATNWLYIGADTGRRKKDKSERGRVMYCDPSGRAHSSKVFFAGRGLNCKDHVCQHEQPAPKGKGSIPGTGCKPGQCPDGRWTRYPVPSRARYVWFEGTKSERKALKRALRYEVLEYPKRPTSEKDA